MVIFGASRGLGAAFNLGVPSCGDTVWLVSRGKPELPGGDGVRRVWIEADLASPGANETVAKAVGDRAIDLAIYNAGIWERDAFRDSYDFARVDDDETRRILAVNLASAITCIRAMPQSRQHRHGEGRERHRLVGTARGSPHDTARGFGRDREVHRSAVERHVRQGDRRDGDDGSRLKRAGRHAGPSRSAKASSRHGSPTSIFTTSARTVLARAST
jgi:NAD(P)-dependent dehydrogenase (short-subunit alcohol dehydrogenase family)